MTTFLTGFIAVLGIILFGGGIWLAVLGGSLYYVAAGLFLIATAVLLRRRSGWAFTIYGVLLIGTLLWSLSEVGPDWWALAPRGWLLVLIGALLLIPWRRENPRRRALPSPGWKFGGRTLMTGLALTVIAAAFSLATDLHYIQGSVPSPSAELTDLERAVPVEEWLAYGRTRGGSHYSPLDQINSDNASSLEQAWEYQTGVVRDPENDPKETTYEVTPTMVDGLLYICTPFQQAIALDPVTGEEVWKFDPAVGQNNKRQHQTCRGLTHYTVEAVPDSPAADGAAPQANAAPACASRILVPTSDARLIALDAKTGEICRTFGQNGTVNLWANMPNVYPGAYHSTSPPAVANGVIVVGGAVNDNVSTTEPSGVIRGYDAFDGRLLWNFDSGNPDQTQPIAADQTYVGNSPNAWSVLSVDAELGLVYVPMGNAPPDQFGGNRTPETERFSSSVTALDLRTGQVRWVFQAVHHDIWDYDVPAQPQLVDLTREGAVVPALVQPTKQGDIYVLDRRTGQPILPVVEQPAPQGAVEGDFTAPTQPTSALSFRPQPLREADMWGATMLDQLYCRIAFRQLNYRGRFTPPSTEGSIVYPGNFGTFNWGGVAIDPVRQVLIANPVYLAFQVKLIPRADDTTSYVSENEPGFNENFGAPYAAEMRPFWSPLGLPCQQPPWGYIAAADLNTGKVIWQHRNGTVRDLSPLPLPFEMGVPGIGGPIITAGNVAFYSGALDNYVRAYNVTDGTEIWRERLPAGGQATPSTYRGADGKQYLVVVAGGHGSTGTDAGDSIIAYRLPDE